MIKEGDDQKVITHLITAVGYNTIVENLLCCMDK